MSQTDSMRPAPVMARGPLFLAREKHLHRLQLAASIVLLTLPFMQIFTLDVGFPLKIYEVAIVLWVGFSIGSMQIVIFDKSIFIRGLLLFGYACCALFIILNVIEDAGVHSDLARINPLFDGLLKCCYIVLCVFGFELVASAVAKNPERAVRMWLVGATISSLIQFFLFSMTAIGHSLPAIPGMPPAPHDQQFMMFHGLTFYRAGTFIEGNQAGPFYLLSFLLAIAFRRYFFAAIFLMATFSTFSTTALVGLFAAVCSMVLADRKRMFLYVFAGITVLAVFINTPVFDTVILNKFADTDQQSSMLVRERSFMSAVEVFMEHPLLGVGIEQFGFHQVGMEGWGKVGGVDVKLGVVKTVPNNVYMELASEFGLVGIGFFLAFLIPILWLVNQCPYPPLRAGSYVILIVWLASPTFSIMYYWAFWAIACGIVRYRQAQEFSEIRASA